MHGSIPKFLDGNFGRFHSRVSSPLTSLCILLYSLVGCRRGRVHKECPKDEKNRNGLIELEEVKNK
jgi:hypothetical protein